MSSPRQRSPGPPQPSEPSAASKKYEEALAALDRADFETARESLDEVFRDQPDHAGAWTHLGVCFLEMGQGQRALEALERAAAIVAADTGPRAAQVHYLLGVAQGVAGELDRALACFRRALELDPAHQKAEEFRVRTEGLLESRQHYKNALALLKDKSHPHYAARALREILLSLSLFAGSPAREELPYCFGELRKTLRDAACALEPGYNFQPFFDACERGYQALRLFNWAAARQAYEEAAAMRAEPFAFHGLALASMGAGDAENALRFWKQLLERDPEFDLGTLGRPRSPRAAERSHGNSTHGPN